ncbi:aminotransferase class IV [Kitasatospora sp. NPDC049285]|uniref:aminotransferase class IV n=1 Tax=Kitasatospora sp. NPDC049285 TaxID=3157096 RepID=UPI003424EBAB
MTELDGRPVTADQLQALALTNYGHFTTMLVEDGRVRGLDLHLTRLERDCRTLFGTAPDRERIRGFARRLAPQRGAAILRITLFDPAIDLGSIGGAAEPRVLVTTRPAGGGEPGPIRVRTVRYRRELPQVKSVGLFGALRLRREAQLAGWDDALFLDDQDRITEGGTWNVGFLRGDRVVWPRGGYLPGTAMALLRAACGGTEEPVGPELAGIDAAFATNAAVGVRPIAAVDGRELGTAGIGRLREAYLAVPGDPL